MTETYTLFSTRIGKLLAAGNEDTVTCITRDADVFIKHNPHMLQAESGSIVSNAANAIRSYLNGAITIMRIPHEAKGTAFQKAVWEHLRLIPYGQTVTYSEIAERMGKPTAFRAVANACGKNPIPLLIPCHRVIHKDGNVSGFAWGIPIKRTLLELETAQSPKAMAA